MSKPLVTLITGASRGIGAATAAAFARAGHPVILATRDEAGLSEVAASLDAPALPVPCDASDPQAVDALFDRIHERHGRLDVLFNNAGTNLPATPFDEIAWEEWRRVLSVNLDAAFLVARAAFAMMRAQDPQGGRIINNGSVSAQVPRYGSAPYTASKHAMTGLTRSIALDGRAAGIACGQIDIGNAASAMTEGMAVGVPQADGHLACEPVMDPKHVADAVLRMAELPLDANVLFQTIMATDMPFVGRG